MPVVTVLQAAGIAALRMNGSSNEVRGCSADLGDGRSSSSIAAETARREGEADSQCISEPRAAPETVGNTRNNTALSRFLTMRMFDIFLL